MDNEHLLPRTLNRRWKRDQFTPTSGRLYVDTSSREWSHRLPCGQVGVQERAEVDLVEPEAVDQDKLMDQDKPVDQASHR